MSAEAGPGDSFDIVVIGGGINGTGIARDAALRGLTVLLLDKADIAAGTTSWSSRLIHGGLRYLEHGEIGLVYESLQERERLLRIAPHLVFPLPLTLPIYDYHKRGPLTIRAGMVAYDALSFNKSLPRHRMFDREGALAHVPGLNPEGLRGAARYYDAQVEFPERLSVENMLDAIAHGAQVCTHARAEEIVLEAGAVRSVNYLDETTGMRHSARTDVVINVTGPWVDNLLTTSGIEPGSSPLLGATKGTHIVVAPFPGAPTDALYIEARSDGRPYFIIPWNGLYLIGTTDSRYDGDPDGVIPSEEEIAYLLSETTIAIPASGLDRGSVAYAYSGLRPLPNHKGAESGVTRRHIIHDHAPKVSGMLSIIGGKLTTYRNLAEHAVDKAGQLLNRSLPRSTSGTMPLPGGIERAGVAARRLRREQPEWLSDGSIAYLVRIYGSRADDVLTLAHDNPELRAIIDPGSGAIGAAIAFAFTSERAVTLTDAIMRRTMIGYSADAGLESAHAAARAAQAVTGWSDSRVEEEIAGHRDYMRRFVPRNLVAP